MTKRSNLLDVGQVSGVFGVKGWLKVRSSTEPAYNILDYKTWWLKTKHGVKSFELVEGKAHNDVFVVQLKGIESREQAAELNLLTIAIERSELPSLPLGEFYWDQLIGLSVINCYGEKLECFGKVTKMLETGANDVLVVSPNADSIDDRERLIPYIPDMYVKKIDLAADTIEVDWDTDF